MGVGGEMLGVGINVAGSRSGVAPRGQRGRLCKARIRLLIRSGSAKFWQGRDHRGEEGGGSYSARFWGDHAADNRLGGGGRTLPSLPGFDFQAKLRLHNDTNTHTQRQRKAISWHGLDGDEVPSELSVQTAKLPALVFSLLGRTVSRTKPVLLL